MATVNISLPDNQAQFIDRLVREYGYGNRSEFFRSVIRLLQRVPSLVTKADEALIYGSEAWWKHEIEEGLKEVKEGKYVTLRNKAELQKYLDNLK